MIKDRLKSQTISYDKMNQLRHVKYFKNADGIKAHMKKHAKLLVPKFNIVLETLEKSLKTMILHPGHLLKADIL